MAQEHHFLSDEASDQLTRLAEEYLRATEEWLQRNAPQMLAERPVEQVVDSAMQGLANAEGLRQKGNGGSMVLALAHQVGLFLIQQTDRPREQSLLAFSALVRESLREIDADITRRGYL
jgi:hypothetical protein